MKILCRIFSFFLFIISGAAAVWMVVAAAVIFGLSISWIICFAGATVIMYTAGIFRKKLLIPLLAAETSFLIFFLTLTPETQFKNRLFQRSYSVKPDINFLSDGTFEVVNYRDNFYRSTSDYDEHFYQRIFDPAKVQSVEIASIYWGYNSLVAHNMINFKFSDGQQLAVSVEPRSPAGIKREVLPCLCKQHELLFILGSPHDLFNLRSAFRGEDVYCYQTTLSPDECRMFLELIIKRTAKLHGEPEFYDLICDNCITAWLPLLREVRPEIKYDWRVIFNGFADRLLFDCGIIKHQENESFESVKSRSFINGKSRGKL